MAPTAEAETTLLTRLEAKSEPAANALAAHLADLAGAVPAEPGCLGYAAHRAEGTLTFVISERWATPEDAQRHARKVENDGTTAVSAPLLNAPLTTWVLRRVAGAPDSPLLTDEGPRL